MGGRAPRQRTAHQVAPLVLGRAVGAGGGDGLAIPCSGDGTIHGVGAGQRFEGMYAYICVYIGELTPAVETPAMDSRLEEAEAEGHLFVNESIARVRAVRPHLNRMGPCPPSH